MECQSEMNQNESNKIRTIRYNICRSIKVVTTFIVYTGFDYNNYYNNLAENYEKTPQEKARALAEAVNYCKANNLLTTQELQLLKGTKKRA